MSDLPISTGGENPLDKDTEKFLGKLFGKPAEEAGLMLAEEIRLFRLGRSISIFKKAQQKFKEAGLDPKKVPVKLLVPLLEHGTLEDNESMHTRWVNLLSNAANPNFKLEVRPDFSAALSQLTPGEADILDYLFDLVCRATPHAFERTNSFGVTAKEISLHRASSKIDLELGFDNLFRLRVCEPAFGTFKSGIL